MSLAELRSKHAALAAVFTERSRRLWAATEARALGYGGAAYGAGVAAFALAENAGKGAIDIDGRMVERLHLTQAEALLAKATMIGGRKI